MVLNAIDKEHRRYDLQLWKLVRDKVTMILGYAGTPVDEDEWPEFAVQFMENLILRVQSGDKSISDAVRDQLNLNIQQLIEEFGTTNAREMAERTFGMKSELGRMIFEVMRQGAGGGLGKKIKEFYEKKKEDKPRTVGSLLGFTMIV